MNDVDSTSVLDFVKEELEVRPHEFVDWQEVLTQIVNTDNYEGAFIGSYSVTLSDRSLTQVSHRHRWCNLPVSASSVARRILQQGLNLTNRKRILFQRRTMPFLALPQPLFCLPTDQLEYLIYIDVRSCYYDLYRRLPFDLFWFGLHVFWDDVWFKDFLPQDLYQYKLCRNSMIGVLRSLSGSKVKKRKVVPTPTRNNLLSPCHWGFIAHLLHHMASLARECNCIYYNTDGAIFLSDFDAVEWAMRVADLGFSTNVKDRGIGWVKGIGCYSVGTSMTNNHMIHGRKHNNLIECNPYVLDAWKKFM